MSSANLTSPRAVVVIDYGLGNLHSVTNALGHLGANVTITSEPDLIAKADRVVLPGVGAYADGMRELHARKLADPIRSFAQTGRPFLGICLGMQLLFTASEEFGEHAGLDLIRGRVVEIAKRPGIKVPHIGWNRITPRPGGSFAGSLLDKTPLGTMVYFVHSFTAVPDHEDDRLADTTYGGQRIAAAVQHENLTGCQFHPEKSGPIGLAMLTRFLAA